MILSGHQPVYLPSLHLFNKIAMSDAFMFVGHCQFVGKSWHSRNNIRLGDKAQTLSVPVKKATRFGQSINETEFDGDHWKRKHLSTIKQAYAKRPYFQAYFPDIEALINKPWKTLGHMNMALIRYFLDQLAIRTPIHDSEDYGIEGQKTDMLIAMCRAVGADRYLSNEGSRSYVDEPWMAKQGIWHCWQGFAHPIYEQGRLPFMENLSVIDALFNLGGETAGQLVRECGSVVVGEFPPAT